jgi:hypothetical protein
MNIRDYFFINKTKNTNKIKILDLLGFEADISIDTSEYESVNIEESENLDQQSFDDLISNTEEITTVPTKSSIETYLNRSDDGSQITLDPSTDTFNPLKITHKFKKYGQILKVEENGYFLHLLYVLVL